MLLCSFGDISRRDHDKEEALVKMRIQANTSILRTSNDDSGDAGKHSYSRILNKLASWGRPPAFARAIAKYVACTST